MQKKPSTKTSILIASIIVLFCSCSKKDPQPSNNNNNGLLGSGCLVSSIDSNGVNILNYEYNSDNKVSKIINVKNNIITTFAYTSNKIIIKEDIAAKNLSSYIDIGSNGFAKQYYYDDKISGSQKTTDTIYYYYDNNNYLTKSIQNSGSYFNNEFLFGSSFKTNNLIQNGNFISSAFTGGFYLAEDAQPTDTISKIVLDYYSDKPSQAAFPFTSSQGTSAVLGSFTSALPKNLIKSISITYPGKSTQSFVYTFNDKGLINTITISQSSYGYSNSYILTLHYTCK